MQQDCDVVIVGGGIVGASLAYWLSPERRVVILEAESTPGYHASGRSAALFAPGYGTASIRQLTRASERFFRSPPPGFSSVPLCLPRGELTVGRQDQLAAVDSLYQALSQEAGREAGQVQRLTGPEALALVPVLQRDMVAGAVLDRRAFDIDTDLLLQGFLRAAKACGAVLECNARVSDIRAASSGWQVHTGDGRVFHGGVLVNAAGAWVDQIADLAGVPRIGIQPKRRSALVFDAPEGLDCSNWPLTVGIDEDWYFKPDAGQLLASPANADPVVPHDVVAEELDIATAIYALEQNTSLRIRRPRHTWAGLRSFVVDGDPVSGFDPQAPGFFWAAALGGYGFQTAPAFGQLCAALLLQQPLPDELRVEGLEVASLSPDRPGVKRSS